MKVGRWSIVVVLLVACGPAIPPLPSAGGPAWLELASGHFTLWTDAGAERGRELVREMERRYQLIMTAMNHYICGCLSSLVSNLCRLVARVALRAVLTSGPGSLDADLA
jgi:hypothetical protein